jgi:2-oxoisovalerate dehydrogenase E1 component
MHTVASKITQIAFDHLDAPPVVLGARNWIVPPAEMEPDYFPQPNWFLDAYHAHLKPLAGYTPTEDFTGPSLLAQAKYGVA